MLPRSCPSGRSTPAAAAVKVEVDLGEANDLQTFKRGVAAIPFYQGFTVTGEAMQVARTQVFTKSRPGASKLLVVITDGRPTHPDDRDELGLVRSESAALRRDHVRIHAIGVGPHIDKDTLELITGASDYSLIDDFDKLTALVEGLVKDICNVKCKDLGEESIPGRCFAGTQRIVHVSKTENKALQRCEKTITHEYKYCGGSHLCKDAESRIEDCINGVRKVITTWEDFDVSQQKCVVRTSVEELDCKSTEECSEPVADIVYVLDSSFSMTDNDWKLQMKFLYNMVNNMKIGPGAIHVGVVIFGTKAWVGINLGSMTSKSALLDRIRLLQRRTGHQATNIPEALRLARSQFADRGRNGVSKVAVLLSDGESNIGGSPVEAASQLEAAGVTIIAVGIGKYLKKEEVKAIATPPLSEHLFFAEDFDDLMNWAIKISQETCEIITPPDPSLCELPPKRLVSECYNGLQKVTELSYEYDAQGRCIRKIKSHTTSSCAVRCTDPINGNQYTDGETWQTECATFVCRRMASQTEVFKPTKRECPGTDKCYVSNSGANFKCHDDHGHMYSHCSCHGQRGSPLLKIITADANAAP